MNPQSAILNLQYQKGVKKMPKKIVVTGGAGFIGSHLVDALIQRGHRVRVLDNLDSQVHGTSTAGKPLHLHPQAEFIYGDVLNEADVKRAIDGMEIIFHEAAVVGIGQSMYQIARYVMANTLGTAQLMDVLVNHKNRIQKVIVAASMSSYGEGAYECEVCGVVYPPPRPETQMARGDWEVHCPQCETRAQRAPTPIPTPEDKPQQVHSIYALTKKNQEEIALMIGKTYRLPVVALRYFNVYGPRQSLSNPYTGVAAIFMSRIKNGHSPVIYEDGLQTRDFVSVHDIVKANILAMERDEADYQVFNVGSGIPVTIREVAEVLALRYAINPGEVIQPQITNHFRKGDVRHCYADISKIRKRLGFSADVSFERGMMELVRWAESAPAEDKFELATQELKAKGLF